MGISHNVNDDEIIALFRKGKSVSDIARKLNTTYETVKYRLVRNGLLVYENGKFIPSKANSISVQDLAETIDLLTKSLRKGPDQDPTLKQIMKLAMVIGDYIPAGLEVYRNAKAMRNGTGSYQELSETVHRLIAEEENVKDLDYSEVY